MLGVRVGQLLHETYRVTALIAAGGMGIVFEAEHLRLSKKKFAIKVLHPTVMEDPAAYVRFRREAEIVSGLGHPHIIYVSDFNELEGGQPYLVMELLQGEDLKRRLKRDGPLTPDQVRRVIEQTASALQVAHDKGIVHRDLKPGNIFLVDSAARDEINVKLLDFGISKIRHSGSSVTEDLTLLGTPFYMAPEQAEGEITDIDHRTDIFSLGTIAYLTLCGKLPFEAASTPGVLFKVCYQEPRPITQHLPELPDRVHEIISRALSKSKTDRYQRAEDFAAELSEALTQVKLPLEQPVVRPPPATVPDLKPPTMEQLMRRGAEDTDASPPPRPPAAAVTGPMPREITEDPVEPDLSSGPLEALDTSQDSLSEVVQDRNQSSTEQPLPAGEDHQQDPGPAPGTMTAAPGLAPASGAETTASPALPAPDTDEVSLSNLEPAEAPEDPLTLSSLPDDDSLSPSTISAAMGEKTDSAVVARPARRLPLLLAGGVGLTLAAAGVITLLALGSSPQTGTGASDRSSSAAAVAASPGVGEVEKPSPRTISIQLRVTPASARVTLDGEHRVDNPLILTPSGKQRRLGVAADGFEPLEHRFVAEADDTIVVMLNKKKAPNPTSSRAAPATVRRLGKAAPGPTGKAARQPPRRRRVTPKTKKPVFIYDDL